METFGNRVREARKKRGMTQKQLAAASGLSQTTISDIERGRNESSADIVALARALVVNAEWLADGRGPRHPGERDEVQAHRDGSHAQAAPLLLSSDAGRSSGAAQSPVAQLAPRWPFPLVDEQAYAALPADAQARVQLNLQALIDVEARAIAAAGKRSA